nr:hypothetical protein [Bacteroides sp. CACC 737]
MSFFSQMDTYGDGYAGIGVWRAAFKPLVDRIADTDIRLQWFCCDRSTGVTDDSGNRITLIRDTQSPVAVEYQAVKFIGTGLITSRPVCSADGNWEIIFTCVQKKLT